MSKTKKDPRHRTGYDRVPVAWGWRGSNGHWVSGEYYSKKEALGRRRDDCVRLCVTTLPPHVPSLFALGEMLTCWSRAAILWPQPKIPNCIRCGAPIEDFPGLRIYRACEDCHREWARQSEDFSLWSAANPVAPTNPEEWRPARSELGRVAMDSMIDAEARWEHIASAVERIVAARVMEEEQLRAREGLGRLLDASGETAPPKGAP